MVLLLLFPFVFLASFFIALKDVIKGKSDAILLFIIFGLSIYTTAMSVAFLYGLKGFIPIFQIFKEILVIITLGLSIVNLKHRPKPHIIDYAILGFFGYTLLYAIFPIGDQSLVNRLVAFKSTSFFLLLYFIGRLIDIRTIYVSKYFKYILLLTIIAGVIVCIEKLIDTHLQSITGFADYVYYFFNFEPSGSFGLSTTFESEGGYKRFGSIFANPLEHAGATLIALAIIIALFTKDDNKFKPKTIGILAIIASLFSIWLALSRAPMASYAFVIYMYALITRKKWITRTVHATIFIGAAYLIYLFNQFEDQHSGPIEVIMNTVDFSNPSSVGHIVQWVEGINAMIQEPLGLGLGSSGRVAASVNENVGGENQYIIIGVQAGIIALFLYLFAYIMLIKTSFKWLPILKGKERQVCMAVLLLKIAFFIPLLTSEIESSSYISYINWFLSGLFVSIIMRPTIVPTLQPAYDN